MQAAEESSSGFKGSLLELLRDQDIKSCLDLFSIGEQLANPVHRGSKRSALAAGVLVLNDISNSESVVTL